MRILRKRYKLASSEYRKSANLRNYEKEITKAVRLVKPDAEVIVENDYYEVIPMLTKTESIAVSAILRMGILKQFTLYRPCLFIGEEIEEE